MLGPLDYHRYIGVYRYIEDRYIGTVSHAFYYNFCQDIEFSSLCREYCYIEDRYIGVKLYFCYC